MMTSYHRARTSKFRENSFTNQLTYLTVPFTFDFYLFITINILDTSLGLFSNQFWFDDVTKLRQNLEILRERFHKRITHLKVPFT